MKKQIRFKVGDTVEWDGGPNEFRNNRHGKIISINKNIAIVDDIRSANRFREVPLNILKYYEN